MKNFKRFVGLLLCLAMVLSFVPASFVSVAKAATTTTDILEKIDISGTAVGGCSTNSASQSDYTKLSWWSDTHDTWGKHLKVVDNSLSSSCDFGADLGAGEFSDFYLDLTLKNGSAISADHLKLYYGADEEADMKTVTIILNLAGSAADVEQTFTTNWSGTTAGDPIEWDFGQTYEIEGIYVYSENDSDTRIDVSYAELELYQNVEVPYLETATLNGVDISEYQIVYSASDLDYAKTAAEYIQEQILLKTGRQLDVVTDATAESTYEIQVGNVNRTYAKSISAPSETAMKFTFASNGTKIAMKADYFIIAGAAYYFVETYIDDANFSVTANTGVTTQNTITEKPKNFIFMIGDGMGEMHTRLFEIYDVPTSGSYDYSDGEDIFYGYYLPYLGWQKTANLYGEITDSAAAGTALATGYKTFNGYIGKDQNLNDVKNMSELAMEYRKSVAVISTEGCDGATPAAYSAHADGRYNDDEIKSDQTSFGGLLIDNYNNYSGFTASEFEEWDALFKSGLNAVKDDPDGFFIMYEEAHIDKVSHRLNYTSPEGETGDTDREVLFRTVYRFNQAIGTFMEYALYNPDTMVLITADHETSGLNSSFIPTEGNPIDEQVYGSVWNHSLKDVPVFAYGAGADIFASSRDDAYENASIARTWADLMTDGNADDFGDSSYPILGDGSTGGSTVTLEALDSSHIVDTAFGYYSNNDTNGALTSYYEDGFGPENLIDGTSSNQARSQYYLYSEIADGTKIPAFVLELDEATVLGGIKFVGYQYGRYNMEDFEIQISTTEGTDTWVTVGSWDDAWVSGTNGNDTNPLTISFADSYTAYKVRVLISQITDMSAEAEDDVNSGELLEGSYIRIKEVTLYYDTAATPGETPDPEDPTDPTEPETQPTEAPTTPAVDPDEPIKQGTVLEIVPATKITPQFGVYTDANLTVFEGGSDAYCLTDGWFGRHADSQKKTTDGTIAAILTLDKTTTLGGIEIVGRVDAGNDMTSFRVQVKTANGWETVVTATSNPFDSGNRTVKYEFATPVATDEVRIIVDSCENTECKIGEIVLYEATTGKAYELIDLTGKGSSTDANPANPVDNLGDTDKTTIFLGSNATFNLTVDGQPTAVDGFNLFAYRGDRTHPTSVQVFVQQDEGGEYVEIGTFDTGWSNTYPLDSLTVTFNQTYYAYNIRFVFDGWDYVNGLELYGYVPDEGGEDPTEPTEPTEPTDPDVLPGVVLEPITNAPTPIVGYYSDNNTNGVPTEYLNEDTVKGKVPAVLVDGKTGSSADYNWTGYYRYDDVASGAKIPAYYFEFDEPTAFTGVKIDGYKAMYYGMENFTVQVYIEGRGWVTATTVADSFGAQTEEEYADPITYPFAEPLYGTKIRILVDKLWNMEKWEYDDEYSFNLEYEASIRLREITLMEDPDYVPPEDAANTLMPPSSLDTEFTDTTITAVAPPSTEYPEAEIRYAVYLNGALVQANSTGIFTGLQPNTRYTIYAKYIGDGDEWLDSHPISNTTATDKLKLPAPNVEVVLGTTTITATADEVEGGELQFRLLDANHVAIGEWQSSGNFTGLTPNTTYYIQARYNGDTNHYDSEVRTLEVETGKILLSKPTLTVSGTTHNTITLNALPTVTGGAAEYSYSVDGIEWIVADGTVITGLNANTTYYLRARYVATDNAYNSSLYSEDVTATTKMDALPAPVLTVVGTTDSSITVTAEPNANGILKFSIDGTNWQESGTFTGLNRNTEYTIQAKYFATGDYTDSAIVSTAATTEKTKLPTPTGLTVTGTTDSSITVTADSNANGTLVYRINGGDWQVSNVFTGLDRNTEYNIEAMYTAADGFINSDVASITATTEKTKLPTPTGLTVTGTTDSSITVTADSNANGTLVYRINGGDWQVSNVFTGLDRNTEYTIEAMYTAADGFINSDVASTTGTTAKTQLTAPTGLTATNITANSITVTADPVVGGTLMFRLAGGEWQTSGTFTGLTHGTNYTIEAMYVADDGYIDSPVRTTSEKTLTILSAPVLSATSTDTTITASAPAVVGGTVQYRINGGAWQASGTFTGLDWNTTYTISAMYVAGEGYVDSGISTISVATTRPADPAAGQYADLEAIPESGITPHVGYNRYSNHEAMWSESTTQADFINDAMYGTVSKIMGEDAVPADKLADGYRLLTIIYDMNGGATKIGAVELTGGDYNLTKFAIQVKNTEGKWQTVKFVTNDLFDISDKLRNDTVLITFTPVTGTRVRLLIDGYEENPNNAPEIREMVVYEAKDDAQLELKSVSSGTTAVFDGNKAKGFTGTTATMYFDNATSVKRLKLFGDTAETSIGAYTVKVQTTQGGAWTEVATGTAFSGASGDNTCIVNLDQEYQVFGIQVIADKSVTIPEIEVYGYKEAFVPADPNLPAETPTDAPERPTAVSPVQTTPAETQPVTVPTGDSGMADPEQAQPNVPAEGMTDPTVAAPVVPDESGDPTVPAPVVPDESGADPTVPAPVVPNESGADPVAPTAPVATKPATVMGWLDAVPATSMTPKVGFYINGDYNTLTDEFTSRESRISDASYHQSVSLEGQVDGNDYAQVLAKTKTPAAVLNVKDGSTKTFGGLEITVTVEDYMTAFDIQVLSNGTWKTVKEITSDPFTSCKTQLFTFDATEGTAIRVRVFDYSGDDPYVVEMTAYEVKVENPLVKIPLTSITTNSASANAATYFVSYLIDGYKYNNYQTFEYSSNYYYDIPLTSNSTAVSISRVRLTAYNPTAYSPKDIVLYVQKTQGGSWTEVYSGTAYTTSSTDVAVIDFDAVDAYALRLVVKSITSNYLVFNEIEAYGPGDGYIEVGGSSSLNLGTPGYDKLDLTGRVTGACSENNPSTTTTDLDNMDWYSTQKPSWDKPWKTATVDNNSTTELHFGAGGSGERADYYLDLTNGAGGYTAVDQIKMYHSGYAAVSAVTFILVLENGSEVKQEYTGLNWKTSKDVDPIVWDFGQTYNVKGVYVWEPKNTTAAFGEIELYQKKTVDLPAPNVDWTSKNDTSITVTAPKIDASVGKLQFKIDGVTSWVDAVDGSYTFTGLTGNTSYTVQAQYVATATGYNSSTVGSVAVVTEVTPVVSFTVTGPTTAGATVKLYKGRVEKYTATVNGSSYTFSNVSVGVYTLVATKDGYNYRVQEITVSADVTQDMTLTQTVYEVSGPTTAGATVKLYKGRVEKYTATVNGSSYTFSNVSVGVYTLVATKDGYNYRVQEITVSADVTQDMTLTQTVYEVSGTTTAGATVQLYKDGAATQYTATMNGSSYTFSNVPIGAYTLVATKDGYNYRTEKVTVNANVTQDMTLTQAVYEVSGTTTAGATVQLYKDGAVVATDVADDGSYSFSNVELGNYTLVFTKYGYTARTEVVTVNQNVARTVELTQITHTISGTVTGTTNDAATVKLYKNGVLVNSTTAAANGTYTFSGVAMGNYSILVEMGKHIAQSATVTVSDTDVIQNFTLSAIPMNSTEVAVDAIVAPVYNVRLYEPWALRVKVTFYTTPGDLNSAINLSNFTSYGAYAIIAHQYGDGTTAPTTWEDIVNDPNAVQFKQAAGEGDGNIWAINDTTAAFDFYEGLYTYRLAENVYWVAYYEDAEGIHFTEVRSPKLMDKVDNIIEKISGDADQDTQRIVLEHMKQLYSALLNFRDEANLGQEYAAGKYLGNVDMGAVNTGTYQFGKSHKIRLIEPWSVKVTYQVRNKSTFTMLDFANATDYGVIFYHDKTGEYYGNMTAAQMLERKDAVIYSKSQGNITLEDGKMVAVYDKGIFTYELDSAIYCLPFVVVDGQYHYGINANRIDLIDQMYAYYNNTTLSNKERATFQAMIQLHESTMVHRKKYGK